MYQTYIGERNSLVFPVMCDGHVLIDYDKNIPDIGDDASVTNDNVYGLWGLEGSFTIEAIVTPYDVNGNSSSTIKTSIKTMPNQSSTNSQSEKYLSLADRVGHSMCIFYSENAQLYLVNTVGSGNYANRPAEYKLQFTVTASGTADTLDSSAVIKGEKSYNTNPEALYLIAPFHIAATFSVSDGVMSLYLNDSLVASDIHSAKSTANTTFSMAKTDCYIGTNGSTSGEAVTRKQFMGEIHEFAISLNAKSDFSFTHTLLPNFRNTLLYLRFEEVDL